MTAGMEMESTIERLNALLAGASLEPLDAELAGRVADYLALLMKWNCLLYTSRCV